MILPKAQTRAGDLGQRMYGSREAQCSTLNALVEHNLEEDEAEESIEDDG